MSTENSGKANIFLSFFIFFFFFFLQKQNGTTTFNALTFNQNVLGTATKYALVSTYNLTVMKLTSSDEGTYRCLVGLKEYDMNLTVVGKKLFYRGS